MVAGTVNIKCSMPKRWKGWPTLWLSFFVMTMDCNGHVNWPTNFSPQSKALLRKLARQKIQARLEEEDSQYPLHPSFSAALTQESEATLQPTVALPALPAPSM